jgi:agmatine deiminase
MPAEWEPHAATWLSWPRPDGISFPGAYAQILPALAKMVDALAESEPVHINVAGPEAEAAARDVLREHGARDGHVVFHFIPTNEPWCRDHGPVFLVRDEAPRMLVVDWDYNAWGWKYPPFDLDDDVPVKIAAELGLECVKPGMVLEGGSIDVNGHGTLLTTESCLLNQNRNPDLTKKQIEARLKDYLGVKKILWLGDGIEGDDTDGHVDDITRFVGRHSVVTVVEEDERDPNYEPLRENLRRLEEMCAEDGKPLRIHPLPMPSKIVREGQRLPASYANFYIGNRVVLMPAFNEVNDRWAAAVLEQAFPDRRIVPIDSRELVWGLGAFHCLTQQQPLV